MLIDELICRLEEMDVFTDIHRKNYSTPNPNRDINDINVFHNTETKFNLDGHTILIRQIYDFINIKFEYYIDSNQIENSYKTTLLWVNIRRLGDGYEYLTKNLFNRFGELSKSELLFRLEEFDVFKDGQVDFISLEQVYEFYKKTYWTKESDEHLIKQNFIKLRKVWEPDLMNQKYI